MENNEFSHLLKKIQWASPDDSLAFRIEAAIQRDGQRNPAYINSSDYGLWYLKSPLLSFMAVILAMILGIGSGIMTGKDASANNLYEKTIYGNTTPSLADIYLKKNEKE